MGSWRIISRVVVVLLAAAAVVCQLACCCAAHRRTAGAEAGPLAVVKTAAPASLMAQLQGTWVSGGANDPWQWTVKGNRLDAKDPDGNYYKATIQADEKASPIRLDIKLTDCSDTSLNGELVKAIVKVEGKTATLCFTEPGGTYPASFDANEGRLIVGEKK